MKNSCSFSSGPNVLLCLGLGLILLGTTRTSGQSQSQNPQANRNTSAVTTPPAQTEAEKKAAERRRGFEEQKNRLDGGGSSAQGTAKHTPVTDKEFWVDPINLNMVPNESQDIHVWDWRYNDVSARVSWSLSDSGIVDMMVKHHATITAKTPGTVSVIGNIDGHRVEAIVTVYRRENLPDGVPRTVSKPLPLNNGGRHRVNTVTTSPN